MPKVQSQRLQTKVDRMAPEGYYVTWYGTADKDLSKLDDYGPRCSPGCFGVVHIKGGYARYVHWMVDLNATDKDWYTLLWSCAPTKRQLEREKKFDPNKKENRTLFFPTHVDLLQFPHIHLQPIALSPSPLDV